MANARAGLLELRVNGVSQKAKGNYTYNLGALKRDGIVGADQIHGYMEKPQIPFVEGEVTDDSDFDLSAMLNVTDTTVILSLRNGKKIVFRNAWFAADGNGQTEESNITVRFEALEAEEV